MDTDPNPCRTVPLTSPICPDLLPLARFCSRPYRFYSRPAYLGLTSSIGGAGNRPSSQEPLQIIKTMRLLIVVAIALPPGSSLKPETKPSPRLSRRLSERSKPRPKLKRKTKSKLLGLSLTLSLNQRLTLGLSLKPLSLSLKG